MTFAWETGARRAMKVMFHVAADFGGTGLGYVSYQAVRGLRDAGMLAGVMCLGHRKTEIEERYIRDIAGLSRLWRRLPRRIANRIGLDALLQENFASLAARRLRPCDLVHGYTGTMLQTIAAARGLGAATVVDRPNTHIRFMRRLLEAEYAKYDVPFPACREDQACREARELEECDAILTCSEFARRTMVAEGLSESNIFVVPYGVDTEAFRPEPKRDRVFRVVFAGLICLRKGVQYLLEAWHKLRLRNAELVLQGHVLDDAADVIRYFGQRCPFSTRPHTEDARELRDLYNSASVCVFPSVEDGFGMVVTEAMACNRPVVITETMGASDLVVSGIDGFVIPPCNADAIKEVLAHLHAHPDSDVGSSGRERVRRLTWDRYRAELLSAYRAIVRGARTHARV